jgi:hypothetical protein
LPSLSFHFFINGWMADFHRAASSVVAYGRGLYIDRQNFRIYRLHDAISNRPTPLKEPS